VVHDDVRVGLDWPLPMTVTSPKDRSFRPLEKTGGEMKPRMALALLIAALTAASVNANFPPVGSCLQSRSATRCTPTWLGRIIAPD
jgi:hypothetical protein